MDDRRAEAFAVHRLPTALDPPEGSSLEVPLQADGTWVPSMWVQTPETVRGFEFRLFIERPSKRGDLWVRAEYVGLPVETALSYARFVLSLYSEEGILRFTLLEGSRQEFDVAELPLLSGENTQARLHSAIRFMENLVAVGEATGEGFIYPSEMTSDDVLAASRGAEIVRAGWITEHVGDLQFTITPEGARALPLDLEPERPLELAIAIESAEDILRVLDREISLGPSLRWIERARLDTSVSQIREWLASNPAPDEGLETRWVPVGNSPMHIFFPEWPKRVSSWGGDAETAPARDPAGG